jgi:transcriptional regulator GlxA family with amidase domain
MRAEQGEFGESTDRRITDVMAAIERGLASRLDLHLLAATVGLSTSRLRALFKLTVGIPISTYIRLSRLKAAAGLLLHTHDRVSAIALSVGLRDVTHLGRQFRRHYGLPPRVFRKLTIRQRQTIDSQI